MRAPVSFVYGNLVFGADARDCWALYRVRTTSYAGLSAQAKHDLFGALAGFAYSVGADFQILRVTRHWSVGDYRAEAIAGIDKRHADPTRVARYLDEQAAALRAGGSRPTVFIAIALTPAAMDRSWAGWLDDLATLVGLRDARGISRRALDELRASEQRTLACIGDFFDCDRGTPTDVAWLTARALRRSAGDPTVDPFWTPQALIANADEADGAEQLLPLEASVLRLSDASITIEPRGLTVETEHAASYQALLTLGALPEVVAFPGRQAEVLFAPLEAVDFDVDAVVSARWIANDQAVALARRKLVDADNALADEAEGDHGPTASGALRPSVARELEDYLSGPDRPPLLRASISLCVAATSEQEAEERVAALRREYAPVALHRPLGSQLDLFVSHLPAQRSRVRDYDDVLTCEQLGAMVPTATHAVGTSSTGLVIGHVVSGAAPPVRFDLTEASRTSRPGAVLCAGTLGSGKTITAQLLAYQALLRGSRVVTIDPKGGGDHRLDTLLDPSEVEVIELAADGADVGRLDPLRIAPPAARADVAYSFLIEVLPSPVPAPWQTEIRAAVNTACRSGAQSSLDVLDLLDAGNDAAQAAGRALRVHADGGLLGLAFATQQSGDEVAAGRALTVLRIAGLTLPLPGTPHAEMAANERASRALLSLLSSYALALLGDDRSRHKVLVVDEAWVLLGDAVGRSLVERMNRLCRSLNVTPILATQVLTDTTDLQALIGAAFLFGVSNDHEAGQALRFAGVDDDPAARSRQRAFRHGRCLMIDYDGRCAPVQITPGQTLLERLDTTPGNGQPALFPLAAA